MSEAPAEVRKCKAVIRGVSPCSFSRLYSMDHPKEERETHDAYERRTWMHRLHVSEGGIVFIPGMCFKLAMENAAKYLGTKIPGQGNKTWTKKLMSAVLVTGDMSLGTKAETVGGEWLHVPADGVRGGGKRVMKQFPRIPAGWEGEIEFLILDPILEEEAFLHFLESAGKYVGVGRFRPQNGGYYGRFEVVTLDWS